MADIIYYSNKDNWIDFIKNNDLLGYTSKEVITLDENVIDTGEHNSTTINAESALNVDDFINTDSITNNIGTNGNRDKTLKQERYNINYNKLQADRFVRANNLWYNISKDIAGVITLQVY